MTAARVVPPDAQEAQAFGMVLGQIVVLLRLQHEWTQAELAQRIGVSQSAVSKIEGGKRPDAFLYGQLARTFGMEVQQLDAKVQESMKRAKEAAAAVTHKKGSTGWEELLALAGFIGIIAFVVAAVFSGDEEEEAQPKKHGRPKTGG